jgi:acetolactate synthase I/II/III large subunit
MGTNGAEAIVDYLIAQRVPYLTGVCGHGIIGLLDAAYDRRDEIETLTVHDERIAGFMADAYFRVAGAPLATYTSCGPGSVNILMAIAGAFQDSSAIFAITGNVPTQQFNRGPFQESGRHFQGDFISAIRPYVKRSFQAARADMLPIILPQAFSLMLTGRTGPVNLDVPLNVFVEAVPDDVTAPEFMLERIHSPGIARDGLVRACELIASAKRPLILAGGGAYRDGARRLLNEVAQRFGVPVITTPLGKGALEETHELALGPIGRNGTYAANEAARKCDVLIALGARFDDRTTSSWTPGMTFNIPPTRLIHVDIDPTEIGRNLTPEVGIVGDAAEFLAALLGSLDPSDAVLDEWSSWRDSVLSWKARWTTDMSVAAAQDTVPMKPARFVAELQRALPPDALILADVGIHHNWLLQQLVIPENTRFLQAWGFAAMGFGVGGVLGAHLAAPGRPVMTVCGDGGFIMHANAVLTAVEYGWPVTWIVWNNGGYGAIEGQQRAFFGPNREIATRFRRGGAGELVTSDCAAIGESMGALGIRVERPNEVGDALRHAIDSGRPCVINVQVDDLEGAPSTGSWDLPPLVGPPPSYHL